MSGEAGRAPALVVGLGSPDRGDDGIGPAVVRSARGELQRRGLSGVHMVDRADPSRLLDLLCVRAWGVVVVVDAAAADGGAPGVVHVLRTGPDSPPLPVAGDDRAAGSHGMGLTAALELARALGHLPEVVTVAVTAEQFDHGRGLAAPVREALPRAVTEVLAAVGRVPAR